MTTQRPLVGVTFFTFSQGSSTPYCVVEGM